VCEDRGANRGTEVIPSFVEAAQQAEAAFQKGDGAFDAGTEALGSPEGRAVLTLGFFC